jgi:hypothetical protein
VLSREREWDRLRYAVDAVPLPSRPTAQGSFRNTGPAEGSVA